ncbi:MAG: alpha/beta fold hydrolase [Planctomycetota bacterium]
MNELLGLAELLVAAFVGALIILSAVIAHGAVRPPRHTAGYAAARGLPADPGDLGLEFDQWMLDRPDGATLPVWEIECGPPPFTAVLVHDWGASRIDMLGRLAPWDELCRRLVLYELRGHGDATGGPSRLGHREEQDLLSLLERLGAGPYLLVGHSMGAGIAIAAAVNAPPAINVAGIVACGPRDDFRTSLQGRLQAAGIPARPLADLAMAWLWLTGIRRVDVRRAEAALRVPVLEGNAATAADAQRFLSRCAGQPGSAASASSSGLR